MAAARARVGSLCSRLSTSLRCHGRTTRLILDSSKLAKQCTASLMLQTPAASAMKKLQNSANFSTSSLLPAIGAQMPQVPENPDGWTTSAGGGISLAEAEEDDDPFMKEMMRRYEIWRRWLAAIMGEDPSDFTEQNVKEAIEYLMPSSLYAKDARPVLPHPTKLYSKRRAQMFDAIGRPIAAAFYTGRPAYHNMIYGIYKQFEKLEHNRVNKAYVEKQKALQDGMTDGMTDEASGSLKATELNNQQDDRDNKSSGAHLTMRWMKKIELENKLEEMLSDREYDTVIHRLKKLSSEPDAYLVQDFLDEYIVPVPNPVMTEATSELDDQGRARGIGERKRAVAEVWINKGSGKITVNGLPFVQYFSRMEDRQQILFPFQVVEGAGEYDAVCHIIGGGCTGQAGAIRLAVSRALINFSEELLDPLQEAGLLIKDTRVVERKKPGQKKARKKFAWVKR